MSFQGKCRTDAYDHCDHTCSRRNIPYRIVFILFLMTLACSWPKSSNAEDSAGNCVESANPHTEGTGHHAGYEWAETHGGSCNGRSQSFNEGCEEYESPKCQLHDLRAFYGKIMDGDHQYV